MTTVLALLLACDSVPTSAQSLPFYDGFDDGDHDGWTVTDDPEPQSGPSVWEVSDGLLMQTSNIWSYAPVELETKYHLGTHITAGDETWADYTMNALVRSADNDGVGLIVRYQDAKNYYRVLLMNDPAWSGRDSVGVPVNTPLQRIQKFVDGEPYILAENKVPEAYPSGFFSLTADVRGDTIRAFLNGEMILHAVDSVYAGGRIGMLSYANAGAYYDSVSVTQERQVYAAPSREITYPVRAGRAPYIQRPTRTSVEIAWRTLDEQVGTVRYGREKGQLDQEVAEHGPRRKHHVKLAGLTPSSRYYYEVHGDGEKLHGEEDVRTARRYDETRFSFLVLGDSGVDTPIQQAVADQMRHSMNESEIDFVVHVGDVHQGSGDAYDEVYFKPYRELIKHVNVFTALGNHDVITDDGAVYLDDFYLPHNNPDSTERYYSFRWANAYFICLDTNIDYSPGSPQQDFLLTALTDSLRQSAQWTFVYAHHPPYSEYWTDYYGEKDVQDQLVPVFEQYDVDMVLNGHTHSYERGEKEHVHYLVSGGGGGSLDDYFVDYDHITFSDGVHHFTRIDVDGDELTVTATDQDGQRVDRFTINRHTSVALEADVAPGGFMLAQNYPNPFQAETQITYGLTEAAQVRLALYDMLGREVMLLLDRRQPPGTYTVRFNPEGLASGRYVYKLTAGAHSRSRQLILAR
ncbi:MAG: metallophosphoesterase [Rhodothermales bacterium]